MFVNTNGLISFLSPINKNHPINNYIPISIPFISPFWSDINTIVGGQIYYRESFCLSDLIQAKNDIANIYSTKFNPSRVYIITWDQVSAYNGNSSINNTFQLVIATDGKLSFLIFNFGSLSWPNSQFTMNSFFGYNAGDNINYYSYPDSFNNNITNVAFQSNLNKPGKWIFIASSANFRTTSTTSTISATSTTSTTTTISTTITTSITSTTFTTSTTTMSTTKLPGLLVYTLTGHSDYVYSLATLSNGNLASGSVDNTVKIWNPNTGSLVYTLTGHSDYVYSLATLSNGNLASGSVDNTVKIWTN
jgi:hypothetical protein